MEPTVFTQLDTQPTKYPLGGNLDVSWSGAWATLTFSVKERWFLSVCKAEWIENFKFNID